MEVFVACALFGGLCVVSSDIDQPTENKKMNPEKDKINGSSIDVIFQNHVLNKLFRLARVYDSLRDQFARKAVTVTGLLQPGRSFSEDDVVTVDETMPMDRFDKILLFQNNS